MLHIINKSATQYKSVTDNLVYIQPDDGILLIEDGVYNGIALATSPFHNPSQPVYALEADVLARGLKAQMAPEVQVISDAQFVDLVVQYPKSISW